MELQSQIILLASMIILSGFFSGSELALFSLSRLRLKHLLKNNVKGAKTLEKLKKNPQRLLITILIGNNIVNVGASALATAIAIELSMNFAVGIATGVMTLLILIFGEITPKSLATTHREKISIIVAKPILILQTMLLPIVILFEIFTNLMTRASGKKEKPLVTEEELKTYVSIGSEIGQINESESEMIHRIFKFDDLEAKDVMTPRNKMICAPEDTKIKDIGKFFQKEGHSRIPIYKDNLDYINGFVHLFDVQRAMQDVKRKSKEIKTIKRPILFVPESKKLDSLLRFFQRKKAHIAMVVDEFGTNIGLITIEDVLEEIVGEIIDETEKIEPMVKRISQNTYRVEARADVDEVNDKCKLDIPEKEAPYTISSYILHELGRIPEEGEIIKFPGCEIKIEERQKNTINTIIVKRLSKKK
ncbi:hemolysin family protein [Nanoarchaeota archaeon]